LGGKGEKRMKKVLIVLTISIMFLLSGCSNPDQSWFQSNVGRYQVLHYTTTTIPHTEFYLRVDTVTGRTEVFHRDGGGIVYMTSFFSPEIEGKKALK
jgi:hypothetical protein